MGLQDGAKLGRLPPHAALLGWRLPGPRGLRVASSLPAGLRRISGSRGSFFLFLFSNSDFLGKFSFLLWTW